MDVIETFKGQVDAAKDIHRLLSRARSVPISTLDTAMHVSWFEPDSEDQIKHAQVIQSHVAVPTPENVHVMLVDDRSMTEPDLRLWQQCQ